MAWRRASSARLALPQGCPMAQQNRASGLASASRFARVSRAALAKSIARFSLPHGWPMLWQNRLLGWTWGALASVPKSTSAAGEADAATRREVKAISMVFIMIESQASTSKDGTGLYRWKLNEGWGVRAFWKLWTFLSGSKINGMDVEISIRRQ